MRREDGLKSVTLVSTKEKVWIRSMEVCSESRGDTPEAEGIGSDPKLGYVGEEIEEDPQTLSKGRSDIKNNVGHGKKAGSGGGG